MCHFKTFKEICFQAIHSNCTIGLLLENSDNQYQWFIDHMELFEWLRLCIVYFSSTRIGSLPTSFLKALLSLCGSGIRYIFGTKTIFKWM